MSTKTILVHCKPSALNDIKSNDLYWNYSHQFGKDEIDVLVTDDSDLDDEDLVDAIGLSYDDVNCIELAG